MFALIGRVEMGHVAELQRLFSLEKAAQHITLDLNDVTLIDRSAVKFLSQCEADSITLKNCPPYIREWIDQEKK